MGRSNLTNTRREPLRPLIPADDTRGSQCSDYRQMIDGILHRARSGARWRTCPNGSAPGRGSTNAIGSYPAKVVIRENVLFGSCSSSCIHPRSAPSESW
ncbi:transposase [Streptomyces odonnellii]|uniref:transposase n=1 Tax=Streptomyces odonnellii TaxID=1417980 RepID=UPI00099C1767